MEGLESKIYEKTVFYCVIKISAPSSGGNRKIDETPLSDKDPFICRKIIGYTTPPFNCFNDLTAADLI